MNAQLEIEVVNNEAFNVADTYTRAYNQTGYEPTFTDITTDQGKAIADAFIYAQHNEQYTPTALQAYREFKQELLAQYLWLTRVGQVNVLPWLNEGQPYANSAELVTDVKENNRLYFFLTGDGFGEDADYSKHPLLVLTGITLNGYELCFNDLFRIVHDYFGHSIYGHQFGPQGETKAWQSHLAMFKSEGARLAISTEAQGQTCWFNYGPHIRREDGSIPTRQDADYVPLNERPYAEQIVAILPNEVFNPIANV